MSRIEEEVIETSNKEYLEFCKIIKDEYASYHGEEACRALFLESVPKFWKENLNKKRDEKQCLLS